MVDTQGPTGYIGHQGTDGSWPNDRVLREFGQETLLAGQGTAENIAYYFKTATMSIVNLIVDDNVPDRGHRVNLLNPEWTHIGIGLGLHANYQNM